MFTCVDGVGSDEHSGLFPTSWTTVARLGKIPTTSVRRRISWLRRSVGLFDHTFIHTAFGVQVNARISSKDSSRKSTTSGKRW